jgi:Flp pilus assembly protein TadB
VAQTKRKRQTKHRGNAAGVVERRGRTTRPDPAAEKERKKQERRAERSKRLDKPPSWRSALGRAGVAAVFFFLIVLLGFHDGVGVAVLLGVVMFVIYIPVSYYTDSFIYRRRRQRQKK